MTTEKLTKEQAEKIKKIAEDIELKNTFSWSKTKEDSIYWSNVYEALQRIAENGLKNSGHKVCDKCGGELK